MPIFKSGHTEIENLRLEASSDHLRSFFRVRIREWRHPLYSGECFTIGVFDDLIDAITPETAFALLPTAIAIAQESSGSEIQTTALALIEDLARKSDTTEIPAGLSDLLRSMDSTQPHEARQAIAGIQTWYRCGNPNIPAAKAPLTP